VHAGAETVEKIAELTLVLLLGSLVTLGGLETPGVAGWLLIPLLLVAIRPLATLAAFTRSSVPLRERAFIGWFGIRGIGSFYYAAAIIGGRVLAEIEAVKVVWTVVVLAGISIVAHGLTATSLSRRV
jgi:NhaP-type Na+/H+ or K+/H+ antiporter